MASLQERKRKGASAFLIQFILRGERKTLFLGTKYSREFASDVKRVVEALVDALTTGRRIDRRTYSWLETLDDDLRKRFEACDLIEAEVDFRLTELFEAYRRAEFPFLKSRTIETKERSFAKFFELVDGDDSAADFGRRDAAFFAAELAKSTDAESSRCGYLRDVARVFNWAVELDVLAKNPFKGVKRGTFINKSREFFVERSVYERAISACDDQEFRAALALWRIGGLRKSEATSIRWRDVDFGGGCLTVRSSKTERYLGKESRRTPLFRGLRIELEALLNERTTENGGAAPSLDEPVLRCAKGWDARVRGLLRTIGAEPWVRLFQNMRASRSNEVYRKFGPIAESRWIGHSQRVAFDHYLGVLDAEFRSALNDD